MKKLEVLRVGLTNIQVCCEKDLTQEQIVQLTNEENLCGTFQGWMMPSNEQYHDMVDRVTPNTENGQVECETDSNRRHWILIC